MFKGEKVILRALRQEDTIRQFEFFQDPEIYGLDCAYPVTTTLPPVSTASTVG